MPGVSAREQHGVLTTFTGRCFRAWCTWPPGGHPMRTIINLVLASLLGLGTANAADQTVLGKQLLLKDPKPSVDATKRKLVVQAKESASADTIVGDPTISGATLTVRVPD